MEMTGRQRDGTEFPINVSLSSIDTGDVLVVITAVRDVIQRTKAVQAAQHMRAMVEYSDDAIIGLTLDGRISSWNPAAERMYGFSSKEIIGRSGSILAPEDRAGEMNAVVARVKEGQAVEHFETTLARKDGTAVPVSITIAPIRDEDGAVVGMAGVHRDVTEQRRAFEAAQRMAAIVEGSHDAIISGSLDGLITSWNAAAERMYGYSSAEVIGKPAEFLTPKDRAGEIKAVLEQIVAGQHVEHLETERVRRDGTVFPVSLTVSPIRDADGAVVGTSVIHRDLTEQKGALATAQHMAAIVEYSDDAIIGSTLEGIITTWNPAAERMYGYSNEQIAGSSVDLLSPDDRAGEIRTILAKIRRGRPVENFETICVRKDRTTFPVKLTVAPILDEGGAVVGASAIARDVYAIARDVTEQK
jgi:PAS domain S-box-containing protein